MSLLESALLGTGPRQASVLTPGSLFPLAFPRGAQWHRAGVHSPVTVAGPCRIHTGFLSPVAAMTR